MTNAEYRGLIEFLLKKFGGLESRMGSLEVGQEAIRDEVKIVAEGTRMNGEAIERNRRASERHFTM